MTAPFTITIRVFESDNGWSWEVRLWSGAMVDVTGAPTATKESTIAYRTATNAWNRARLVADRMVR